MQRLSFVCRAKAVSSAGRPMRAFGRYGGLVLLVGFALVDEAAEPTECQRSLVVVDTPWPSYPTPAQARPYLPGTAYMHVFVEGTVSVEFTVETSGSVSGIRIMETVVDWLAFRGQRFPEGYFDGFLEMNVIPTLQRWRYEPIPEPCDARMSFTYKFADDA